MYHLSKIKYVQTRIQEGTSEISFVTIHKTFHHSHSLLKKVSFEVDSRLSGKIIVVRLLEAKAYLQILFTLFHSVTVLSVLLLHTHWKALS
ncbi:hypothetical protein IKI14_06005 [bacterium]|nr:hypothetical protein [bacterium]